MNQIDIQIIQADPSHAEAIAAIGRSSFYDAFEHLFKSKVELREYLDYSYDPTKIKKSIQKENNIYLLVKDENIPAGFVKMKKYSLNSQIESGSQMELQKIYVLSEKHDKGIGLELINKTIQYAQLARTECIWLNVHISNENAIRFYRKRGFSFTGKHFFSIGTQTFEFHLMRLPIDKKEQLHFKPEKNNIWN